MSDRSGFSEHLGARRRRVAVAWIVTGLLWFAAAPLGFPTSVVSAANSSLDVEPDTGSVPAGATVTLVARVYGTDGLLDTQGSSQVRFFFASGSPNDPGDPGNNPDMSCHTGSAGECSVSYVAVLEGTDTICAITNGPTSQCSEPVGAPELVDLVDVVEQVVTGGANPALACNDSHPGPRLATPRRRPRHLIDRRHAGPDPRRRRPQTPRPASCRPHADADPSPPADGAPDTTPAARPHADPTPADTDARAHLVRPRRDAPAPDADATPTRIDPDTLHRRRRPRLIRPRRRHPTPTTPPGPTPTPRCR
jgi:hypothetical protein